MEETDAKESNSASSQPQKASRSKKKGGENSLSTKTEQPMTSTSTKSCENGEVLMNVNEHSKKQNNEVLEEAALNFNQLDKCPVCLQPFSSDYSKSYTSQCFHAFCFECILEWSKVRYQCPLCKTDFDRIIYNVVSSLQYKEYGLKPRESTPTQDIIPIYPEDEATRSLEPPRSRASWVVKFERAPVEFRMLLYTQGWYVSKYQTSSYVRTTNIELETSNHSACVTSDNLECVAYQPIVECRDVSTEFYTANPAILHRISEFLYRELRALAGILPPNRSIPRLNQKLRHDLNHLILNLIKTTPLESKQFLNQISPYIRPLKYAHHFQHELLAFAMSKFKTLIDYDAHCVYYKSREDIPRRAETKKIFPMRSLPVLLTKYKYTTFPSNEFGLNLVSLRYLENDNDTVLPIMRAIQAAGEVVEGGNDESDMPSDQSSFCEELTPPRKKTPEVISLVSSSDSGSSSSDTESATSINLTESTKRSRNSSRVSASESGSPRKSHRRHRHREKKSKKKKKKKRKSDKKRLKN